MHRHICWALLLPTGPNPRTGNNTDTEAIGDETAIHIYSSIHDGKSWLFRPVIIRGDTTDLAGSQLRNCLHRSCTVRKGQEGGSGKEGLVGPFNASPMIALDIRGRKILAYVYRRNSHKKPPVEAVAFVEAKSCPETVGKEEEYVVPVATAVPVAIAPSIGTNEIDRKRQHRTVGKNLRAVGVSIGQHTHIHDGAVIQDNVTSESVRIVTFI